MFVSYIIPRGVIERYKGDDNDDDAFYEHLREEVAVGRLKKSFGEYEINGREVKLPLKQNIIDNEYRYLEVK